MNKQHRLEEQMMNHESGTEGMSPRSGRIMMKALSALKSESALFYSSFIIHHSSFETTGTVA
jgi:hypothetical protein